MLSRGYAVQRCCLYVADGRQRSVFIPLWQKHNYSLEMESETTN